MSVCQSMPRAPSDRRHPLPNFDLCIRRCFTALRFRYWFIFDFALPLYINDDCMRVVYSPAWENGASGVQGWSVTPVLTQIKTDRQNTDIIYHRAYGRISLRCWNDVRDLAPPLDTTCRSCRHVRGSPRSIRSFCRVFALQVRIAYGSQRQIEVSGV